MSVTSTLIDGIAHETMLLACAGFLLCGLDDLMLDAVYWAARLGRWRRVAVTDLPPGARGRLAIFVPAWDEGDVIAAMLGTMLARFDDDGDFRVYVGVYPNDGATIDAVAPIASGQDRLRIVVNEAPGPTTKADCLNALWRALLRDERREDRRALAIVLHDAEDVVHHDELRVLRAFLTDHQVVQLPVMPIADPASPLVAGHYLDEFSEGHIRTLWARARIGAPLPLAGVGCAIERDLLGRLAARRGGAPFDPDSLTEDYEMGLQTAMLGARQAFARILDHRGCLVAVHEYFPATLHAAIRQKARWMTGIALSGWDRLGWGRAADWRDHWMRMHDRRAPLAMIVLSTAYVALIAWGASLAFHYVTGTESAPFDPLLSMLLTVNAALLVWRLTSRMLFTGRWYGWPQGLLAIVRAPVANFIALLAARRALWQYVGTLRGRPAAWDKTAHRYPEIAPER